jgi:aromatic ring hydroxylase
MKLPILIEFNSGEKATYTAQAVEWAKWEKATGNTIGKAADSIGIWDLMFLAYNAHKREAGGKPVKNFEVWMETVADVTVLDADPKVSSQEASTES